MVKSEALIQEGKIFLGRSVEPEYLELKLANRHGLVTGATGTGKTVTLQVLAEGFSDAGVPVFAADIKGDLSGISQPGEHEGRPRQARQGDRPRRLVQRRLSRPCSGTCSARQGHPIRATVQDMGPLLLRACSSSTRRRRACSTSCSASRPTRTCRCST